MRSEKRRLALLMSAVRPAKSLAARLANLTAEQQAAYRSWRVEADRWQQDRPGTNAYGRLIEGEFGPGLRPDVQKALFGEIVAISADSTVAQAEDIYRLAAFGDG